MIHLILGGARSGKSRYGLSVANDLAARQQVNKYFVATATSFDDEMQHRIERHQQERGKDWPLAEVPLALPEYLAQQSGPGVMLVDCLTLWLNNQFYHFPEQDFPALFQSLTEALQQCPLDVVLIANEIGLGVIPAGDVSRRFVDQAGWLNQAVAAIADRVTLVVAGIPVIVKEVQA
ncbi:bifunctional adenosylcobinamide kinase/adenosylcobinamide-phosphate guanylyltransferase [Oceanobacter sp. 3_MG-2023]|jgi:adenosylcobinamide kinase/adenosylcobinamide-phosphate guanylyltransferase|uniref:bifunctional adenosylcobinamide kinase/adenosylcobinamide-phosphate guanylyltransferase n=1 Tax=Oceanobacter sp. 3_MG-2023 TaxID=3062622 RepID=UPI002735B5C3|nr:bifunctional adenosylcobinamide kinase/adenosylcobinamide-phosphate guanylyltransferase [Oceanobacter sp. 3_MG-2023]MDP2504421.1 bifunctional adenosylcobinamide kinase/adenosylcobinamide-phosphate guanylyltransferase [Oceanobacter sp. 3_MG-2023]